MKRKGFTLVEMLVSVVILAMLMVSLAVAFQASVNSYNGNESLHKATNTARLALNRITTQLRNAQAVATNSPSNQCSLIASDGSDVTYNYNSSDRKLYLVTNDDLADQDYVLCENVSGMNFSYVNTADESGLNYVKYVKIVISVTCGQNEKKLAAAAVVRKNL